MLGLVTAVSLGVLALRKSGDLNTGPSPLAHNRAGAALCKDSKIGHSTSELGSKAPLRKSDRSLPVSRRLSAERDFALGLSKWPYHPPSRPAQQACAIARQSHGRFSWLVGLARPLLELPLRWPCGGIRQL